MTTNYDRRPIVPADAWLTDDTGGIVGIEIANAGQQKTYLVSTDSPGTGATFTDATITTATITTANVTTANVTTENVATLNVTGTSNLFNPVGFFGNLSTVVAGTPALAMVTNSQMVMYSPFEVQNAGGVAISGEMRIYSWPV